MGLFNFRRTTTPKTSAERYLEHLDRIFQREAEFLQHESMTEGIPGVTSIVYRDVPEKGFITAFTYGLSLVPHPAWKFGRPELCISVKSSDMSWGSVVGYLANKLRGDCPFSYGQTIDFQEQISDDTKMDAFFIFAPSVLHKNDYLNLDLGTDYKISIAGLYPMYSEELEVFRNIGLEAFWHHPSFDMYDVQRKKIRG